MLPEEIKGFYHGITKIFLLVGSYTMLSWQLIKEVFIAVYQHLNIKAQFNFWLPIAVYLIKSMFKQCKELPIMLKNSPIVHSAST